MNPFEIASEDVFANPDFTETAEVRGGRVSVIASGVTDDPRLGEFGLDEGVSFFLRIRKRDVSSVRKNDLIKFRGVEYRAAAVRLDSAGLVWEVDLRSTSGR